MRVPAADRPAIFGFAPGKTGRFCKLRIMPIALAIRLFRYVGMVRKNPKVLVE